jgi:hypothetical protein
MPNLAYADTQLYRLALVPPDAIGVLVETVNRKTALPRIEIRIDRRPAQQITELVEERWGLSCIVIDQISHDVEGVPCVVAELLTTLQSVDFTDLHILKSDRFHELDIDQRCLSALTMVMNRDNCSGRELTQIGWLRNAMSWIKNSASARHVEFCGKPQQLNGGGGFQLVRLETVTGAAIWLKAVASPNLHEFQITTGLSKLCPGFLPRLLCSRTDWNAWVTEEFGTSLHSNLSLPNALLAVDTLACLQVALANQTETLLGLGCGDQRLSHLASKVDDVISFLDDAMSKQTSTKVAPMSQERLKRTGVAVREACEKMQGLGIPDSIMHNDLSPGSILIQGSQCVFTDWCEAYCGNPFLTFELFCIHVERWTNDSPNWLPLMRDHYSRGWASTLSTTTVKKAFSLSKVIAIFSLIFARGEYVGATSSSTMPFLGHIRSLARRLEREVEQLPSLVTQ